MRATRQGVNVCVYIYMYGHVHLFLSRFALVCKNYAPRYAPHIFIYIYIYAVSPRVCAKGVRQKKGEEGGSGALENDFLITFNKKP